MEARAVRDVTTRARRAVDTGYLVPVGLLLDPPL